MIYVANIKKDIAKMAFKLYSTSLKFAFRNVIRMGKYSTSDYMMVEIV